MPTVSPHEVSPNIGNLMVGRGYLSIQRQGESVFARCGNVTEFTFEVKPTRLDHYDSSQGVQTKDLVAVTRLEASLTLTMEEFTARNLAFAVLGTFVESPPGTYAVDMFTEPLIYAALEFTATNVVGPQWGVLFPLVLLAPSKAISLLSAGSGAWGDMAFTGDVLRDPHTNQFGIFTSTDIASP